MFKFSNAMKPAFALALVPLLFATHATAADNYSGVGRAATPAEIKAWDIDVRPDFKGLPKDRVALNKVRSSGKPSVPAVTVPLVKITPCSLR